MLLAVACAGRESRSAMSPSAAVPCTKPNATGDPNTSSPPRCVSFSGFDWVVKASPRFEPGPNAWSDAVSNLWVDERGLHLKITGNAGQWRASEVALNGSFGYGTYTIRTATRLADLDRNVVFGFFVYDYADPAFSHREIDIEYSPSLGFTAGKNAHFTVQPFTLAGRTHDFAADPGLSSGQHSFEWRSDKVMFQSAGETWTLTAPDVPRPGRENVRLNLWLFKGLQPTNGSEAEVVISSFEYQP